jgi:hypothetical protein
MTMKIRVRQEKDIGNWHSKNRVTPKQIKSGSHSSGGDLVAAVFCQVL